MNLEISAPLEPIYPFNEPGQPIDLFSGLVGGIGETDLPGKIQLVCSVKPKIEWNIDSGDPLIAQGKSDAQLILRGDGVARSLSGFWLDPRRGIANATSHGQNDAPLKRMIAHWINLPKWDSPVGLTANLAGQQKWWRGRWQLKVNGWSITFDTRPDHSEVYKEVDRTPVYVMTHIMELRRSDDADFTAIDAMPVLDALDIGISFALGRRAVPMLPVGQDAAGETIWADWGVRSCDPAKKITSGWWYDQDIDSLGILLDRIVKKAVDPDELNQLRLQLMLAISAIDDQGFLEQRILSGASGLEHLEWQALALSNRMSRSKYREESCFEGIKMNAAGRLRLLLKEAGISRRIDSTLLPAMVKYAEDAEDETVPDGPEVVTRVRNKIVHPKGNQEKIYRHEGLLREVWCSTRHYLALLILHSLNYTGSYRDLRKLDGPTNEVSPVPWTLV